ncbi:hypothetical protein BV25DRAFT_1922061 [Artomyces pyxidatus]|uniref:Uncharacterized protein n=1 Tax=Artomyces pyxidatus TaxID=48021 RepID=A0ACB8SFU7_9AGAM|nr:hypothetical protein BV25DRAFT_1922061 [Artomyces pyxidatus]
MALIRAFLTRRHSSFDTLTLNTATPGVHELYAFLSDNGQRRHPMHIGCVFMSEREDGAPSEGSEEPRSSSTGAAAESHNTSLNNPTPQSRNSCEEQGGNSHADGMHQSDDKTQRGSVQPHDDQGSGLPDVKDFINDDPPIFARACPVDKPEGRRGDEQSRQQSVQVHSSSNKQATSTSSSAISATLPVPASDPMEGLYPGESEDELEHHTKPSEPLCGSMDAPMNSKIVTDTGTWYKWTQCVFDDNGSLEVLSEQSSQIRDVVREANMMQMPQILF